MMPMIYLISTSLKPNGALYEFSPRFFPTLKSMTIQNYIYIINQGKFYVAWVIPYSTFMLKGFIENIPKEFDEAIYMDGGGIFTVYSRIILPLIKPGIASVSIFNFLTPIAISGFLDSISLLNGGMYLRYLL
jgi:multiple sugar transport system permease protein